MLRVGLLALVLLAVACAEPPAAGIDAGETVALDGGAALDGGIAGVDAGDGTAAPAGCSAAGQFPAPAADDPWASVATLRGQELRAALLDRIKDHAWIPYNDARRAMFSPDGGIDVQGGLVECIYTGRTVAAVGATSNGMNVEHTWPQSEGAELEPEASDLHHLFPADGDANLRRASYPYADTDCDQSGTCLWALGGSKLGVQTGGGQRVFEVRPESRGDVARAHFYFAVRYERAIDGFEERALRCWNWSDPPDERERARNAAIESIQANRNPFVDRPDLVESIPDF